jgi:hypothetical protein
MMITYEALVNEGIAGVIEKLVELAAASSVTINPHAFQETGDPSDRRLPPLDVDGSSRLLERPLWGKNELYGTFALPFELDESLFDRSPYRPDSDPQRKDIASETVPVARKAGLEAALSCSPFRIPDVAEVDAPRDFEGNPVSPTISLHACPNNPRCYDYAQGIILNLAQHYEPDSLVCDWIEYTNYFFTDNLICFCEHCRKQADEWGYNFESMRQAVAELYNWIRNARPYDVLPIGGWHQTWAMMSPRIDELFRFKARTVVETATRLRAALDRLGFESLLLRFPGFAYPMSVGTGLDYASLSRLGNTIIPQSKMYRFHWGLMVGWYAHALTKLNANGVAPTDWLPMVVSMMEIHDDAEQSLERFVMPPPTERGPVTLATELAKSRRFAAEAGHAAREIRVHAYGPLEVFRERLSNAMKSGLTGFDIQRYGYCSDEKLRAIGETASM